MATLSKKKFKEALPGSHGVQAVIARKLNLDRSTITKFLNKHPDMRNLCVQEREKIIDVAENRLFKAADNGEKWAVDKILSTIGKDRGYVETQNIDHSGRVDNKVQLEVIDIQIPEDEDPNNESIQEDG